MRLPFEEARQLVVKAAQLARKRTVSAHRNYVRARNLRRARRRAFIDCGANTCSVLREYIRIFPDFEFFAFEPQPELLAEGHKVVAEHPATKITFMDKAVWISNETLDFYLATRWGPNYKGGSTLLHGHVTNRGAIDYSRPVQVQAIDFSEWLGSNFSRLDYVIVKMDIEGAEYPVLEKLIADNNHWIIKELIIEFHQHMYPTISKARHDALLKTLRRFARVEIWH